MDNSTATPPSSVPTGPPVLALPDKINSGEPGADPGADPSADPTQSVTFLSHSAAEITQPTTVVLAQPTAQLNEQTPLSNQVSLRHDASLDNKACVGDQTPLGNQPSSLNNHHVQLHNQVVSLENQASINDQTSLINQASLINQVSLSNDATSINQAVLSNQAGQNNIGVLNNSMLLSNDTTLNPDVTLSNPAPKPIALQKNPPKKPKKFYAVAVGRNPGIYDTWEECRAEITGATKATYKSFLTFQEAKDFISNHRMKKEGADNPNQKKRPDFLLFQEQYNSEIKRLQREAKKEQMRKEHLAKQQGEVVPVTVTTPVPPMPAPPPPPARRPEPEDGSISMCLWFDGGSRTQNKGPEKRVVAGAGAVLEVTAPTKKQKFLLRHYLSEVAPGLSSSACNNFAEYTGLLIGLREAVRVYEGGTEPQKTASLAVRGDSLLVINQVIGLFKCKSQNIFPRYKETMMLLQEMERMGIAVELNHVHKDANTEADALCNEAMDWLKSYTTTSNVDLTDENRNVQTIVTTEETGMKEHIPGKDDKIDEPQAKTEEVAMITDEGQSSQIPSQLGEEPQSQLVLTTQQEYMPQIVMDLANADPPAKKLKTNHMEAASAEVQQILADQAKEVEHPRPDMPSGLMEI